jgi:hypothetical protein
MSKRETHEVWQEEASEQINSLYQPETELAQRTAPMPTAPRVQAHCELFVGGAGI